MITFLLTILAAYMANRCYKNTEYEWAMFWSLMLGWNLHINLTDLF